MPPRDRNLYLPDIILLYIKIVSYKEVFSKEQLTLLDTTLQYRQPAVLLNETGLSK